MNTYVPQLHGDLIVEFSRNPDRFPIAKYVDVRKVDKQKGYFVQMLNDGQARVEFATDPVWADGSDSPKVVDGTDEFEFSQFNCVRRRLPKMLGYLAVEQAGWDILDQASRFLAMQLMTHRAYRIGQTLTTSGNWNGNYATATTAGGGTWGSASSTNPYIRKSIIYAQIAIEQGTYGVVESGDLYLVLNPNTAKVVATSGEFLDYLKQQPSALPIWEGQDQFRKYGLPEDLLGCRVVVDNTVCNSALPGQSASLSFTIPDNYAILMTRQKAITPAAGSSFSTMEVFAYEEMVVEVFNDVENRRYKLYCTDTLDTSFIFAPASGYLIATNS